MAVSFNDRSLELAIRVLEFQGASFSSGLCKAQFFRMTDRVQG